MFRLRCFPALDFLREAKESGVYELYYIELATGLRRGELLGLKWEDIDLEGGTIQVRRQIARIDGEVVEAPLKTKNSYRSVSIGQDAVQILNEQRRKTNSEYVFPSPTGGPISPDSVLNMLHRVLKRAGLPRIRFHDMRHPYVKPTTKNFYTCLANKHLGFLSYIFATPNTGKNTILPQYLHCSKYSSRHSPPSIISRATSFPT